MEIHVFDQICQLQNFCFPLILEVVLDMDRYVGFLLEHAFYAFYLNGLLLRARIFDANSFTRLTYNMSHRFLLTLVLFFQVL